MVFIFVFVKYFYWVIFDFSYMWLIELDVGIGFRSVVFVLDLNLKFGCIFLYVFFKLKNKRVI